MERDWGAMDAEEAQGYLPLFINSQGLNPETGGYRIVASWDSAAYDDMNLHQPTKDNVWCIDSIHRSNTASSGVPVHDTPHQGEHCQPSARPDPG